MTVAPVLHAERPSELSGTLISHAADACTVAKLGAFDAGILRSTDLGEECNRHEQHGRAHFTVQ